MSVHRGHPEHPLRLTATYFTVAVVLCLLLVVADAPSPLVALTLGVAVADYARMRSPETGSWLAVGATTAVFLALATWLLIEIVRWAWV